MITSCSLFACALVSLVAAMALGTSSAARADGRALGCGEYTLHGSYVFTAHGWNIVGGIAQPKAIVEGINFNGDGTLVSPYATVSINGTILHSSGSLGTYTVNPDCTGTLSFTGGPSFDISVEVSGRQLKYVGTDPTGGIVVGGSMVKQ